MTTAVTVSGTEASRAAGNRHEKRRVGAERRRQKRARAPDAVAREGFERRERLMTENLEDEMGYDVDSLLKWMAEVAAARNCDPRARTVNLKFSKATLDMWQDRVSNALAVTR